MKALLLVSRTIDFINEKIGHFLYWLILATVLISTGNAVVRKLINESSNSFLEIQWYLFSAVFLLGSAYALKHDEHVRIDVISSKLSEKTRAWVDVFGFIFFLFPVALLVLYYAVPFFWSSLVMNEMSSDAGGLVRWPAKLLVPLGFFLLFLQGLSELIKRIAFIRGMGKFYTVKGAH